MKKKQIILVLSVFALSAIVVSTGCRKRKEFKAETGQTSEDNRNVQSQTDQGISDANNAINGSSMSGARVAGMPSVLTTICGASIDSTGISNGSITINYDGTVCNNRKREGSIKLTILNFASGVRWKDAGAVLQVDYINYKVTRASDDKSLMFNGTHLVTNVSGGGWWDLFIGNQSSLIHSVAASGAMNVTFDDGSTATANVNRKFTYTWSGIVLTCLGQGTGSYNSLNNLENYGTTRAGDTYTSQVTTDFIWNTTCGVWAPIQGEVDIHVDSKEFQMICTFGVDANGDPVSVGANDCPYGWKLYKKFKRKEKTIVHGYL